MNIKENYIFLPIEGIGNGKKPNYKDIQQKSSEELIKINKRNPVLLCDGDQIGISMKKVNQESALKVIKLKDIDESFKDIESLFDKVDITKYKLNEKKSSTSSLIKNLVTDYKFTQNTKVNFKKVFNFLKENIN